MIHRIGLPLCHDHPNSSGSIPNNCMRSIMRLHPSTEPSRMILPDPRSSLTVTFCTIRNACIVVTFSGMMGHCSHSYVNTHHLSHQHRCTYAEQHGCPHLRRGEEYSICSKFGFTFIEYGFDLPLRMRGPWDFRVVFRRQGCPAPHRMGDVRYDHFEVPVGL